MKSMLIAAVGGLALVATGGAALAQPHTTVTEVHGPMKVLPHHNKKICKVRWVHHKRVKKCWYH